MGKYFGTDGFRGKAGVALTAQHAFQTGRFLGWYYGRKHLDDKAKIVIGKDTRRSSYMYESALAAGITSSGADAYLLHVTTTPCVSYITRTENFDCGVMISASHNPFYDNGIKLMNGKGEKMDDDLQDALEKYIDGETEELPTGTELLFRRAGVSHALAVSGMHLVFLSAALAFLFPRLGLPRPAVSVLTDCLSSLRTWKTQCACKTNAHRHRPGWQG